MPTTGTVVGRPARTPPPFTPFPAGHRRQSRWSGSRSRGLLAAGVAGLMLLLAGAAALPIWERHVSSPLYTVQAYYDALADRDAEQAQALLAPGFDGNGQADASLLTSRVLRDPGYHPPRDVRLEIPDPGRPGSVSHPNSEDAVVVAGYTAAGRSYHQELRLIPHDAGRLEHKWRLANPLLPLEVPRETGTTIVAGTLLPATSRAAIAFPGAYTVTLPRQEFVHAEPVTLLAGPTDLVPLKPTLLAGAQAEIERQVHAYITFCTLGREVKAEDCPFHDPVDPYAGLISSKIIEYPTLRIETGSWGELMVTSAKPGQVEYTPRTFEPGSPRARTDFVVVGRVRVTGDTIAFTRN